MLGSCSTTVLTAWSDRFLDDCFNDDNIGEKEFCVKYVADEGAICGHGRSGCTETSIFGASPIIDNLDIVGNLESDDGVDDINDDDDDNDVDVDNDEDDDNDDDDKDEDDDADFESG